ncbi:HAD-IA family hydrolase [Photobacterium sp. SDRW27]|uniref:HAD-IA family hydrolase n=1 Tax=Photobacterium obscurum TaxID=2829490 RepID=UPI002243BDD5|nr:HAD-IA family hydrolase [Photobacterium obscurum]MCW8328618.1 HAD-IA family hydrolase [Photobacterium obscurum]
MLDIQAILFDLDGTLIDSTPCVEAVWTAWAKKHNVDKDRLLSEVHGCRGMEIIPRFKPELNVHAENERLLQQEIMHAGSVSVIPGVKDLINSLDGLPWGIVTMSSKELALAKLAETGLPIPNILITADDVINGKPHPESYLLGAEKLEVEPSQCLVFEDAKSGIESAKAAGMEVVQVMFSGHTNIQPQITAYVQDMSSVSVQAVNQQLKIVL